MINTVELKNFKSIKDYKFKLRNLNLMAGLNGMGKSTFIQSLLLLRQSKNLNIGELRLNDQYVKIGQGQDAFYQYSKEDTMYFDISFRSGIQQRFEFLYIRESDYFEAVTEEDTPIDFFNQSLFTNPFYYLNANRLEPKVIHDKSYSVVVVERGLGNYGEYVVHFLEEYGEHEVPFANLIHEKSEIVETAGIKNIDKSLFAQVNNWLGEISPGVRLITTEIPNTDHIKLDIQYHQPNRGFTEKFRPTNVGFGVSYVLPVITALLSATAGQIVIIENPESHIHPKGQAELGKLIALASSNDVQVMIETHSDHVLNGIRVAVRENKIEKEKVALFYFEKKIEEEEQYSKITEISINSNGDLSEYPDNLLDEWSTQLMKLV